MPYIAATLSKKLTDEEKISLKSGFGKAIECIKGKSEAWLMVSITDEVDMYFKGDNSKPCAYISVEVFGTTSKKDCDEMTSVLCTLINDVTGIPEECTYVTYTDRDKWGWNGSNF